jgi:methyl-accepting chemotaxis protein
MSETRGIGLFPKLFLAMTLVAVLPLGAVWYLDYRSSVERLNAELEDRLQGQATAAAAAVDSWLDMNLRMARQNAALEDLAGMDGKRQRPILKAIAAEYRWVYLAHTIAPGGMNVARSDEEAAKDYKDRTYVQLILGGAPAYQQVVVGKTSGQPALIVAVPILSHEKLAGVLALATTVDEISKSVTNRRVGKTGFAFLADESGNVIAHPKERGTLKDHPALVKLGPGEGRRVEFKEKDGRAVVGFARRTTTGWTLVVQQDVEEAYERIGRANRIAFGLLVATLALVGLVAWFVARQFAQPILNLTRIAEEISRGALTATIEEAGRTDEIGGLARAIERLRASVKLAMERLSR